MVRNLLEAIKANRSLLREPHTLNLRVAGTLAGPAIRGMVLRQGKRGDTTLVPTSHDVAFDWTYERARPDLQRLTRKARERQWDPDNALDWSVTLDPQDTRYDVLPDQLLFLREIPSYRRLDDREQRLHRYKLAGWMLSQFLHGEQGALFAACQVTEGLSDMDARMYGATQVADEGRHVDVFHRYIDKMEARYAINDNLFVVLDALMRDGRWDLKFLGMQILVEGLALGAFGVMRASTSEPLLRDMLAYVIRDEARHVHFGVAVLEQAYKQMPEAERRMREDWAYEMCVLIRNRFLAHELYEELYAHRMSVREWDDIVLKSDFLRRFRERMFKGIVPNLKRIGLLTDRVRRHYDALGLLEWEDAPAAPDVDEGGLLT